MEIRIAKAVDDDMPDIYKLIVELARYEKLEEFVATDPARLTQHLERGFFEALIARDNRGEPLGMAVYYTAYSTWNGPYLWLEDLVVIPSARKHGVGTALMEALKQKALDKKTPYLRWQVLDWNEPAIGFYRKLGARPESEWITWRLVLNV